MKNGNAIRMEMEGKKQKNEKKKKGGGGGIESGCNYAQIFDSSFKTLFHKLGVTIGKNPWYFVIVPTLFCLLLGAGFLKFSYVNDPEYLFAPVQGQAKDERSVVEHFFPMNYSGMFDPSRFVRPGRVARLFVTAKDGEGLLRQKIWKEIKELDQLIRKIQITDGGDDGGEFDFESLCARWQDACFETSVLELGDMMAGIEAGNVTLTYPVMFNPINFKVYSFPQFLGGTVVSNESTVQSFQALQILYFLKAETPTDERRGFKWEGAVLDHLAHADAQWTSINVDRNVYRTYGDEVDTSILSAIPFMLITVPLMVLFACATCMSKDWVRAKPWLGIVGILSAALGTLAGFGAVCFFTPLISMNVAGLFLMLGIGIDDGFVMLAAWRQTSVRDPVPKRMGEAYAEAAVSITITSLTDMLSFWVGIAAPFHSVRIFCLYTGAAVVGTYICHILIFGGAMALSGYHEADNRHGLLFWRKAITKSKVDPTKSWLYRQFFTGGKDPSDPFNPLDEREHSLMSFFRDRWAVWLNKKSVKAGILTVFVLYLAVACWGISKTEEGLELKKLSGYGSYAEKFFDIEDAYFRHYPYRVQVVITGSGEPGGRLDYSNKTVQEKIEGMMTEFEQSKYIQGGPIFTESWLRSFLGYANRLKSLDLELNMTTERDFIQSLKENYLGPSSIFSEDVKFNEDDSQIVASRFIIQTVNISNAIEDTEMVTELRRIAKAQAPELNVTVFNSYFIFFDQYLLIRSTTIQCVAIAGLIMMAVSLVFIPNPLCSLWVAFSILSIEAGVLGFLALWNVNLDVVSMINLIICIGFSVDFSAHISYAYMSARPVIDTPDERVKSCLYSLGVPIVQGALSTILGVLTLLFAPSYILNTFFKSVVLVMLIAALHGLLLLPVLLSLFGPGSCRRGKDGDLEKSKPVEFQEKYTKYLEGVPNPAYLPEMHL